MKNLAIAAAIASLFVPFGASAALYSEVPDAGQALGTAQALPGGTDTVSGSLSGDADLYSFYWGGGAFYANTIGGTIGDSQLFLFNSAGVGVLGNDDGIAYAGPAYVSTASLAAGQYFLGVSSYDLDPYSSSGLIFQSYPYEPVYGPSNLSPLAYWGGGSYHTGTYQINFQQVTSTGQPVGDPIPTVPEPASLGLLGLGVAGLAFLRRRRKRT